MSLFFGKEKVSGTFSSGNTSGDGSLQEKTITASTANQIVTPDPAYNGLSKVTVNGMNQVALATPEITISNTGVITASNKQTTAGYIPSGTRSASKQLTTKSSAIITPTTEDQTIEAGTYIAGKQIIKGEPNLVAENIKLNTYMFGILGTFEGEGEGEGGLAPDVTFVSGTFSVSGSSATNVDVTFSSPLIAEPDIIFFYESGTTNYSSYRMRFAIGVSTKVGGIFPSSSSAMNYQIRNYGYSTSNTYNYSSATYPISYNANLTTFSSTYPSIRNATKTGFKACAYSSSYQLYGTYKYIAVTL